RADMIAPLIVLLLFCGLIALAWHFPVPLPVGPLYWDLSQYTEAAARLAAGQMQSVDFTAPAGPLGYALFTLAQYWLPHAHPWLLAEWAPLSITAPLMALLMIDIAPRSRATAWALLLPFLLFSALPFNLAEIYPAPGFDASGMDSRQTARLLYLLAAALIFMRNPVLYGLVTGLALAALFFLKINGF